MPDHRLRLVFLLTLASILFSSGISAQITFSHASGFYDESFMLSMMSSLADGQIVYTLDGSNPQQSGTALSGGSAVDIFIDPDSEKNRTLTPAVIIRASVISDSLEVSFPEARTFIFLDRVKSQTHPGGDWPPSNISDRSIQFMDYEMDPEVVNSSEYASQMDEALLDLPSLSVITDNYSLFDPQYGIYVNAEGQGYDWERECSVELIKPDGAEGFNVNAGLRIRGGYSRHNDYPKHAFRLFFREEYGDAKLNYPLFEDEGVSEFDKVDLRCAQNYSWANTKGQYNTYVREVFTRDSQGEAGQPYTRSRYYHLYLNGMYWGIYQTQERSEARFASDYFGENKEDYDVIKISGLDYSKEIVATDGNLEKWKEIYDFTVQGFTDNESYYKLEGKDASGKGIPGGEVYVDIDNLIDYMINIIYSGNYDSPVSAWGGNKHPNNMYAITNRNKKSEGFKFFVHDGEHTLMNDATAGPGVGLYENRANIGDRTGSDRMNVSGFTFFHSQWLHYKLSKNEEYRIRFANRAWAQLTGNGLFTRDRATERFNRRADQIETAIIAESARWGDTRASVPFTKDNAWLPQLEVVRNDYFPYRPGIVIDQLKELDLFPAISAPVLKEEGKPILDRMLAFTSSLHISLSNPGSAGVIYYTLDGTDPRKIGGEVSAAAVSHTSGSNIEITSSTLLKSRILSGNKWSAEIEVLFLKEQSDYSDLKVTEVHYHPLDSVIGVDTISGKSYEFIEFRNVSSDEGINLSGLVLDSAIHFEFPDATVLLPEHYFVVAAKPGKFFERYGLAPSGNFSGNLSNGGEQVIVRKSTGEILMDFTFDDFAPWPEQPDGGGPSLVSTELNPEGDPNDPYYWTAGVVMHGTPFYHQLLSGIEQPGPGLNSLKFRIYPNPTDDLLMIQLTAEQETSANIRIYDLRGTLHYSARFNNDAEISLDGLNISHGVYLVEITTTAAKEIKKVIYTPRAGLY